MITNLTLHEAEHGRDVEIRRYDVVVDLRERPDAPPVLRTASIEVRIEMSEIVRSLAEKVVRSQAGRSIGLNGLVRVTRLGVSEEAPKP